MYDIVMHTNIRNHDMHHNRYIPRQAQSMSKAFNTGSICSPRKKVDRMDGLKTSPLKNVNTSRRRRWPSTSSEDDCKSLLQFFIDDTNGAALSALYISLKWMKVVLDILAIFLGLSVNNTIVCVVLGWRGDRGWDLGRKPLFTRYQYQCLNLFTVRVNFTAFWRHTSYDLLYKSS